MSRLLALLLLLLQLVFVALPGDGLVLCLGSDHGPAGCGTDGSHDHAPRDDGGHPPVHRDGSGEDCGGVHVTRGELEAWHTVSPAVLPSPTADAVVVMAGPCAIRAAADRAPRGHGGAPPLPPPRHATDVVRVTCLRI